MCRLLLETRIFGLLFAPSCAVIAWLPLQDLHAQTAETARVTDSTGGAISNAAYHSVSAVGQGVAAGLASGAGHVTYGGFLQTFVNRPDLDNDQDGFVDEDDPDDDNDGLYDGAELTGTAYTPVTGTDLFTADSDQDGASDGHESAAGTNPLDAGSLLRFVSLDPEGSGTIAGWQSRGGRQYELQAAMTLEQLETNPVILETVQASGGDSPWFETTTFSTNAAFDAFTYFRVRVHE
jgi:hypothetical protein